MTLGFTLVLFAYFSRPAYFVFVIWIRIGHVDCSFKTGRWLSCLSFSSDVINICHVPSIELVPLQAVVNLFNNHRSKPAILINDFEVMLSLGSVSQIQSTGLNP